MVTGEHADPNGEITGDYNGQKYIGSDGSIWTWTLGSDSSGGTYYLNHNIVEGGVVGTIIYEKGLQLYFEKDNLNPSNWPSSFTQLAFDKYDINSNDRSAELINATSIRIEVDSENWAEYSVAYHSVINPAFPSGSYEMYKFQSVTLTDSAGNRPAQVPYSEDPAYYTLITNLSAEGSGTNSWVLSGSLLGASGTSGTSGTSGRDGNHGWGVTMQGQVSNASELPTEGNSNGDAYITQDDDALWIWTEVDGWMSGGSIQGPSGTSGTSGINGSQGEPGADGTSGTSGRDGTSAAGSLVTYSIQVNMVSGSINSERPIESVMGPDGMLFDGDSWSVSEWNITKLGNNLTLTHPLGSRLLNATAYGKNGGNYFHVPIAGKTASQFSLVQDQFSTVAAFNAVTSINTGAATAGTTTIDIVFQVAI